MEGGDRGIFITLALLLGIFLQLIFYFADVRDTPNKAVIEFADAYFRCEKSIGDRLCEEKKVVDDVNVVDAYIYDATQRAKNLGYSKWYMKDYLYHIKTYTLSKDYECAKVRLVGEVGSGLRSFFGFNKHHIDETIDLKWEKGKWKVCGNIFSLFKG